MIMDYFIAPDDIEQKKEKYKQKKLNETLKNNRKSTIGFGYKYKPLQFDAFEDKE